MRASRKFWLWVLAIVGTIIILVMAVTAHSSQGPGPVVAALVFAWLLAPILAVIDPIASWQARLVSRLPNREMRRLHRRHGHDQ